MEDGVAERSFATQVAKQVGIDPLTIELADKKSWEMMEEEKLIKEQKDMKMEEMMKFLSEWWSRFYESLWKLIMKDK